MSIIIKKEGKFYRQTTEEDEVFLDNLENRLVEAKRTKSEFIIKETKDRDDQIAEIQNEINQIKSL